MKLVFTLLVAAALFSTSECNATPAQERNFEASEEAEESVGDEETLIGRNPDDMDDWDNPANETEAIEEAEPYPETR
jgi:hypothetical protein